MHNVSTCDFTRRLLAVMIAGVVLVTGACSSGSDQKADASSTTGSTSKPADDRDAPTKTESSAKATAPAEDKVLGTTTGQVPAGPNDGTMVPMRMDVTSVKRLSGDTVEVRFDLTNTDDETTYKPYSTLSGSTSIYGGGNDVGGVALLDRPNDKKYQTLFDTEETCLCSDLSNVELAPGKTVPLYADVTAPPKSTSTVDLSLPGFAPIMGLEIR